MLRAMIALGLALTVLSALRVPGPLSPRNANYRIEATLDPKQHTVSGKERLTWRNTASGPATELVFHLYANAFKNEASTFFREGKGKLRMSSAQKHGWGAIDVEKLVVGGQDLTAQLTVDDTLATVKLPQPIAAGATVEIDVEWKTLLPKVYARSGYHEDFFAVAQWFPKIGVWDCAQSCRWRAHQHHANSEFFADFGVYDVTLDVPEAFIVGAVGVRTREEHKNGRAILGYHAEDVHDFSFFAWPKFVKRVEQFTDAHGTVEIELLGVPGREVNMPRHFAAAKAGLVEMERRFGVWPYSRLTIIDVPDGAEGAGGMEYPTLITTFDGPAPSGVHLPELVTAHEFAHQYFQGMVASDEVEEAWLDEGFTETSTTWILDRMFGPRESEYGLGAHHASAVEMARLSYRGKANLDPLETLAFEYVDRGAYGAITYSKTAAALRTLEQHLGSARFEAGMRRYVDQWRFRHPRIDDFVQAFDEGAGQDLRWFWDPVLRGTQVLDYQVLSVETRQLHPPAGLFDDPPGSGPKGRKEREPKPSPKDPWHSEVTVHRKGDFVFPVALTVRFADGSEKREAWDGGRDGARWKRFSYDGEHKAVSAQLDPVPLDVARWNDGLRDEPDEGPRTRAVGTLTQLVSTLLSLVGF
jgi:hypothetical protein